MKVAIVVPWRAGDPDRERAWAWVEQWWKRLDWPIYRVEHRGPEPFNRAWCINQGARLAWPFDAIVAIDADVFADDHDQIRRGVERCLDTGKLIVPHTVGADLSREGTAELLAGSAGWREMTNDVREICTSRVTIVRADLFCHVGGFDERFRGWGHEDVAFWAATVPVNGVEQLPGTAWHLWHQPSLARARRTQEWHDGQKLSERYQAAFRNGLPAIAKVLEERGPNERFDPDIGPTPDEAAVDVIVLTAGRRAYLEKTLASFAEHVHGEIVNRTIQDDSGDPEFGAWLQATYPDWEIITTAGKTGFTEAIRSVWAHEQSRNGAGSPFIFHLEEDFTFDRDVELGDLITILEHEPRLAQVALLRGPWAPPEIAAGGIIEQHPESYRRKRLGDLVYLKHRRFFTTNPCLYRRSLLGFGWPAQQGSEMGFTRRMRTRGWSFAFLGDGTPQVTHIGDERVGLGY